MTLITTRYSNRQLNNLFLCSEGETCGRTLGITFRPENRSGLWSWLALDTNWLECRLSHKFLTWLENFVTWIRDFISPASLLVSHFLLLLALGQSTVVIFCHHFICVQHLRFVRPTLTIALTISVSQSWLFTRATLCWRGICCHYVSVRLSVTSRSFTKTAKCIYHTNNAARQTWTRILWSKRPLRNSEWITPTDEEPTAGEVGKIAFFDRWKSLRFWRPCRRKFVSIYHDGPSPRRCAGGGICGVINNVGGSVSLLITFRSTAHWTSTTLDGWWWWWWW